MHIAKQRIFRLGAGLAAIAAVLALVLAMGTFSGTEQASAQEGDQAFFAQGAAATLQHSGGTVRVVSPAT